MTYYGNDTENQPNEEIYRTESGRVPDAKFHCPQDVLLSWEQPMTKCTGYYQPEKPTQIPVSRVSLEPHYMGLLD